MKLLTEIWNKNCMITLRNRNMRRDTNGNEALENLIQKIMTHVSSTTPLSTTVWFENAACVTATQHVTTLTRTALRRHAPNWVQTTPQPQRNSTLWSKPRAHWRARTLRHTHTQKTNKQEITFFEKHLFRMNYSKGHMDGCSSNLFFAQSLGCSAIIPASLFNSLLCAFRDVFISSTERRSNTFLGHCQAFSKRVARIRQPWTQKQTLKERRSSLS